AKVTEVLMRLQTILALESFLFSLLTGGKPYSIL
ncbi:MAG: hypothetical protein ACI9Y1_003642, partial [Lentisphaeria bacterium]